MGSNEEKQTSSAMRNGEEQLNITQILVPEKLTSSVDFVELTNASFEVGKPTFCIEDEMDAGAGALLNLAGIFASVVVGLIQAADWVQIASTATTVVALSSPSALASPSRLVA